MALERVHPWGGDFLSLGLRPVVDFPDGPAVGTLAGDVKNIPSAIRFVCVRDAHIVVGRSVPDGLGVSTIHDGAWAYCESAKADEPHEWHAIEPMPIQLIRHGHAWRLAPQSDVSETDTPSAD